MELRPVQTALLAGRTASRWAISIWKTTTTSGPSIPLAIYSSSIVRPFSSTRSALQEAEATTPLPGGGMAGYLNRQRLQQQQEPQPKQQQQQQQRVQGQQLQTRQSSSQNAQANSIFPPSSGSPSDFRSPWASKHSNAQVVPASARSSMQNIAELGLADQMKPELTDIERQMQGAYYERPIDVKYRLRPVIGRTVELSTGPSALDGNAPRHLDFAKALARLDMQMRINRVRADVNAQRFHERNGLKRKRLRSERWQRRFKDGFRATCRRVGELAKQGW